MSRSTSSGGSGGSQTTTLVNHHVSLERKKAQAAKRRLSEQEMATQNLARAQRERADAVKRELARNEKEKQRKGQEAAARKKQEQQQQRVAQQRRVLRQQQERAGANKQQGKVASSGASSEQPSLRLSPSDGSMPSMPKEIDKDAIGALGKLGSSMDCGHNHAGFCSLGNPEFDDPPRCRTVCKICEEESLVKEEDVTRLGSEHKTAASQARKCKQKEAAAVEHEKVAVEEAEAAEAAAARAAEKALEMKAGAAVARRRAEEATRAAKAARIEADLANRKWVRGRDALAEVVRIETAHRRAEKMQKRSAEKKEKAEKMLKPTWEEMQLKRSIVARLIYEAMSNAFHKIDTEVDNKVTLEEWVNGYDSVKHHGLDGEPFVALASVGTEERARAMFDEIAGRPDGDGDEEEKGDNKNDDNAKGERVILLEQWCEFLKDAGTSV